MVDATNRLFEKLVLDVDKARRVFKTRALELFDAIVVGDPVRGLPGTPVDLGAAQKSWQIKVDKDTEDELVIKIWSEGVDYVIYLEFGHSGQAPRGMFRIAIRSFSRELLGRIDLLGG